MYAYLLYNIIWTQKFYRHAIGVNLEGREIIVVFIQTKVSTKSKRQLEKSGLMLSKIILFYVMFITSPCPGGGNGTVTF